MTVDELKAFVLSKILDINNKIREIEDIVSSNGLDAKKDCVYIILVSKREAYEEILNQIKETKYVKRGFN